jgi:hypothetical protein
MKTNDQLHAATALTVGKSFCYTVNSRTSGRLRRSKELWRTEIVLAAVGNENIFPRLYSHYPCYLLTFTIAAAYEKGELYRRRIYKLFCYPSPYNISFSSTNGETGMQMYTEEKKVMGITDHDT